MGSRVRIMNRKSYKALEIEYAYTHDGANARQWPFNEHMTQQWLIKEPEIVDAIFTLKENDGIRIYPNPSDGIFTIDFEDTSAANAQVTIVTVNGRIVCQDFVAGTGTYTLTNQLEAGVYVVQVIMNDEVRTARVIIK
jgi:hypothetical protein